MRLLWSLVAFILAVPFAPFADAATSSKKWEQLTDCRFIPWEHADGDSFRARCGAREYVFRLYYVDAPETRFSNPERVREQRDYFGISLDDVLTAGNSASARLRYLLRGSFTVWTRWAGAAGRSTEPRYYALVETVEGNVAEILLREGLARTKGVFVNHPSGERSKSYVVRLRTFEADAKKQRKGAWMRSTK